MKELDGCTLIQGFRKFPGTVLKNEEIIEIQEDAIFVSKSTGKHVFKSDKTGRIFYFRKNKKTEHYEWVIFNKETERWNKTFGVDLMIGRREYC